MENHRTRPRLYVPAPLSVGAAVTLLPDQAHYIRHVLRQDVGATLRLFNGTQGEFLGDIMTADKKQVSVRLTAQLRTPDAAAPRRVLLFSLVKKEALDTILTKATELGVTDIQPLLSDRAVVRALNADRARDQVVEATEQAERLAPPVIHPLMSLSQALTTWAAQMPVYACLEALTGAVRPRLSICGDAATLIGPEGGWTAAEAEKIRLHTNIHPLSLGKTILRADTACLAALTLLAAAQEEN